MNQKMIDFLGNISLFTFGAASIMVTSLGYPFQGAIFGLLSEPGFYWASWKSKSWAMYVLTTWWTGWWAVMLWRNF